MKVLYIHHCGDTGGASNSLIHLLTELKKNHSIEIVVATPEGPVVERFKKIVDTVEIIPTPRMFVSVSGVKLLYLRTLLEFLKPHSKTWVNDLVKRHNPDIIHLNEGGLFTTAKTLKKNFNIPVIMHCRVVANSNYPAFNKFAAKKINKYVDHLICIDGSVLKVMDRVVKKSLIYNPVSSVFNEVLPKVKSDKFRILFLSNFLSQKGIGELIKAAINLKDKSTIKFVVAGSNVKPKEFYSSLKGRILDALGIYPDWQKRMDNAIAKHHLKNVQLLGQIVPTNELFANVDALLLPIHMNEPSRSVFEAGAYGVPSIITLHDKVEDIVKHEKTGIIVKFGQQKKLEESIVNLSESPEFVEEMGQACIKKFRANHNVVEIANDVFDIYQNHLKSEN